ncbi:hypothetical protein FKP32DRAFT_636463 [Trametes sanguinea]|nr:hypothetical protein FKP32DRAFT_636463 [Trametes sanguinea]
MPCLWGVPVTARSHYAYVPPRSAQPQSMAMPVLSHAQSGSARRAQGREEGNMEHRGAPMPPPPLPRGLEQRASVDPRMQMRPPATPQLGSEPRMLPQRPSFLPPPTPQMSASGGSQRFVPQTPGKGMPSSASRNFGPGSARPQQQQDYSTQRFNPSRNAQRLPAMASGSGSGSLAGSASVAQTPMRAASMSASGTGGQRTPFIPGGGPAFK